MKTIKLFHYLAIIVLLLIVSQKAVAQIKTLTGKNITATDMDKFIKNQMDSLHIPAISISIIEDGKVVYYMAQGSKDSSNNPIDSNTLFEAASMTKPVFAYVVHKLVKRKILDLDTPLYKYYPDKDIEYDDRSKLITARMVLSHTTGLPNWRTGDTLAFIATPGTKYGYSGEGMNILEKLWSI